MEPRRRPRGAVILLVLGAVAFALVGVLVRSGGDDAGDEEAGPVTTAEGADRAPTVTEERRGIQGSPQSPLALGETVVLGEWAVSVTGVDLDADAALAAERPSHEPAPDGFRHVVADVGLQHRPPEPTTEPGVSWLAVELTLVDGAGAEFGTADCRAVTGRDLFSAPDVYAGGVVEGADCFLVPTDVDLGPGAALRVEHQAGSPDRTTAWFTVDRDTAPPTNPWPPEPVPFDPAAAPGWERASPRAWGEPAELGGTTVTITSVETDADAEVLEANSFNDPPPEGFRYALVEVTVDSDDPEVVSDLVVALVGPDHRVLPHFRCGAALGEGSLATDPVRDGDALRGTVCVLAPAEQLDAPTAALRVTSFRSDGEAWFLLRPAS